MIRERDLTRLLDGAWGYGLCLCPGAARLSQLRSNLISLDILIAGLFTITITELL